MTDPSTSRNVPVHVRAGNRLLEGAETVIYVGVAALLLPTAGGLLVGAAGRLPGVLGECEPVALEMLDALLLRRKEREPGEGDESDDPYSPDRARPAEKALGDEPA